MDNPITATVWKAITDHNQEGKQTLIDILQKNWDGFNLPVWTFIPNNEPKDAQKLSLVMVAQFVKVLVLVSDQAILQSHKLHSAACQHLSFFQGNHCSNVRHLPTGFGKTQGGCYTS